MTQSYCCVSLFLKYIINWPVSVLIYCFLVQEARIKVSDQRMFLHREFLFFSADSQSFVHIIRLDLNKFLVCCNFSWLCGWSAQLSDSVSLSVSNWVSCSTLTVTMNSVPSSITSYYHQRCYIFYQHGSLPATINLYFIAQFNSYAEVKLPAL